jgi:hypothetical protein
MHHRTLGRLAMLVLPVLALASLATPASSQSKATFQQWSGRPRKASRSCSPW